VTTRYVDGLYIVRAVFTGVGQLWCFDLSNGLGLWPGINNLPAGY
jgi:hypothetical protein